MKPAKPLTASPGNQYPYGKVFGYKLIVNTRKEDREIDLGDIYKIRLYSSDSYIYNIVLIIVAAAFFVATALYMKTLVSMGLAFVMGLIALFLAFRVRVPLLYISILLKKNSETLNIRVKKHHRKLADDFIFYVNGEILKQDRRRSNDAVASMRLKL